jgi:hypothetical protein
LKYDWIGFCIVAAFCFVITLGPIASRFPKKLSVIISIGFLARIVGSLIRYAVLYGFYEGGDAGRYFRLGVQYSSFIWALDFSFFNPTYWRYANWWGTQMVMFITGFVLSIIGPTQPGGFLFFSILSFIGLLLFCKCFQNNYPNSNLKYYATWLFLWPSLWFWPSSIGKDALILLSTGLLVYGYAGNRKRISWIPLCLSLALASVIRPHIAGVMAAALAIAHLLTPKRKWTALHAVQGLVILILVVLVLRQGFSKLGIEDVDFDSIKDYANSVSVRTATGGSAISTPGFGPLGIPFAFLNMLFRPFPWEAGNVFSAAASLEMIVFWSVIIIRRKRVKALLEQWRSTRLLRVGLPLTVLYILTLGLTIGNLGIIARQRIHIMPLLFIWVEALPISLAAPVVALVKRKPRWTIVMRPQKST